MMFNSPCAFILVLSILKEVCIFLATFEKDQLYLQKNSQ